ncbi:cupin [Enterovibrio norvegicus]|uniref:cupin domain-containing protein n=1 Tax=Enterovibrio norvegicus TaxID=188144 RepID=UPI0002E486E2|nr:cupin domain-containing protein [Enterovibrio norvegicus]OEE43376.1 cupin [Enterovibrio norvegicus]
MSKAPRISLSDAFSKVSFLDGRTPDHSLSGDGQDCFGTLSDYRDGGIFIAHYSGSSEWERHPGDELVQVIEGETTIYLLIDGEEKPVSLLAGELVVVPQGIWHRFSTPVGVKVMTVTPQPTEHSIVFPST